MSAQETYFDDDLGVWVPVDRLLFWLRRGRNIVANHPADRIPWFSDVDHLLIGARTLVTPTVGNAEESANP